MWVTTIGLGEAGMDTVPASCAERPDRRVPSS